MQAVRIRQADAVGLAGPLVLLVLGLGLATRTPAWTTALTVWATCLFAGVTALVLRARYPSRVTDAVAAFWPLPVVFALYSTLNPLIDRVSPTLMDPFILRADHLLFGGYPAVYFAGDLPPPLVDLLMIAYVSYYAWPVAMAVRLYVRGEHEQLQPVHHPGGAGNLAELPVLRAGPGHRPALHPGEPLRRPAQGWLLGTALYEALLRSPMIRDCFPSGHTALSLLILWYAFRHDRRFFWVMLPFAVGIISATLLMRFHYVLDLVFAVPFLLGVHALYELLGRLLPEAWTWDGVGHLKPVHLHQP